MKQRIQEPTPFTKQPLLWLNIDPFFGHPTLGLEGLDLAKRGKKRSENAGFQTPKWHLFRTFRKGNW